MILADAVRPADSARPAGRRRVRLDTSLELLLERAPADLNARVLATVVATAGSTYRKPGARMMIMADGSYLGLLSGGCLEADLKLHAQSVLDSGVARAVEYDMRGPDDILFGIGAGCEGAMRVMLEPAGPGTLAAASLATAGRATRANLDAWLLTVHESADLALGTYSAGDELPAVALRAAQQALIDGASRAFEFDAPGRTRCYIQVLSPAAHLLICGGGPDAQPVAAAACALRWRVTVVEHRPAFALAARFPGAHVLLADAGALRSIVAAESCHAAVVMSHHLASDAAYLRALAEAGAPDYVGLLGPSSRRARLIEELGAAAAGLHGRLRGPVGMDLGAVTPEGIALAIVSEIHAWLAGRNSELQFAPI
jgi:xanthine dehydrogenase accessory factor